MNQRLDYHWQNYGRLQKFAHNQIIYVLTLIFPAHRCPSGDKVLKIAIELLN